MARHRRPAGAGTVVLLIIAGIATVVGLIVYSVYLEMNP